MGYRIPTQNSKFYLPKHEYLQFKHFALRYPDLQKERIKLLLSGAKAITYDGMPHGNSIQNPVEAAGIRLDQIDRQISTIEDTAAEVGGTIYRWLLKGVTEEGIKYENLIQSTDRIPCGRRAYYNCRQRFYYQLSRKIVFLCYENL